MIENREPNNVETLNVEYRGADDLVSDYSENLCAGKLFLATRRSLEVGTPVHLKLSFPGLRQPIDVKGVVRWLPDEGTPAGLGIEIPDTEVRRSLATQVERIQARDPAIMVRVVRILVVEDNPHVARLIRSGLKSKRTNRLEIETAFDFQVARNGREALDLLHGDGFDLLIVDMYLPILDGAQLITSVRADDGLAALPVLAVSAGGKQARREAMNAGANRFLDKPLRLREVLSIIYEMIDL